jgi:hypothetical protein
MDIGVMFLDCPAYMDSSGAARCGLPAAVEYRYTMRSTDGPLESAKIRCPRGHCFNGPLEALLWDKPPVSSPRIHDQDAGSRRPDRLHTSHNVLSIGRKKIRTICTYRN